MEYKPPSIARAYTVEFAADLPAGVTISSCVWTLETGLTEDSKSVVDTTATITLSGGEAGKVYKVTAAGTGTDNKDYEQLFFLTVQHEIN